jgi:hypothetical protein
MISIEYAFLSKVLADAMRKAAEIKGNNNNELFDLCKCRICYLGPAQEIYFKPATYFPLKHFNSEY